MRKTANIAVTAAITAAIVTLGLFVFRQSYLRLAEALCDLGRSVGYCFCEICGTEHGITPTVTEYSGVMQRDIVFPSDFTGFRASANKYFTLLIRKDNFTGWVHTLGRTLGTAATSISVLLSGLLLTGCQSSQSTETIPAVRSFQLERYLGTWYEIARLPHKFERGMTDVSAVYTLQENEFMGKSDIQMMIRDIKFKEE